MKNPIRAIMPTAALATLLCIGGSAAAYDAEDNALSTDPFYADTSVDPGDTGGGGTIGFGTWGAVPPALVLPSSGFDLFASTLLDNSTTGTTFGWPGSGGTGFVASRGHAVPVVAGTKFGCRLEYLPGTTSTDIATFGLGGTTYVTADPFISPVWIAGPGIPTGIPVLEPIWVIATDTTGTGSPIDVTITSLVSIAAFPTTPIAGTPPSSFDFTYTDDADLDGAFLFNVLIIDTTGTLPVELDAFEVE